MRLPEIPLGWSDRENRRELAVLLGKTLISIEGDGEKTELVFRCSDGTVYGMWHEQYCCETVAIEDICGDLRDLIGSPITLAEEVTSESDPEGFTHEASEWRESFTWTFYKLGTVKGCVTIRWLGESNGYYSESVEFAELKAAA